MDMAPRKSVKNDSLKTCEEPLKPLGNDESEMMGLVHIAYSK